VAEREIVSQSCTERRAHIVMQCVDCVCSRESAACKETTNDTDEPLIIKDQPKATVVQVAKEREERKRKQELLVHKLARQNCASLAHLLLIIKKQKKHGQFVFADGGNDWAKAATLRSKSDPGINESKLKVLARLLRTKLRPRMHCIRFSSYERSLTGAEIIAWLVENKEAAERKSALKLAQKLMDSSDLSPVNRIEDEPTAHFHDTHIHLYHMSTTNTAAQSGLDKYHDLKQFEKLAAPMPEDTSVAVVHWQQSSGVDKQRAIFVQYIIEVHSMGQTWQLSKRYREFSHFHKQLLATGCRGLPTLPRKHAGSSSSTTTTKNKVLDRALSKVRKWDTDFLESRKEALDFYIRAVCLVAIAQPELVEVVLAFLDDEHTHDATEDAIEATYADL
jgi:hypothetical protein